MGKGASVPDAPEVDAYKQQISGLQEKAAKLYESDKATSRRLSNRVGSGMSRGFANERKTLKQGMRALEGTWDDASGSIKDSRREVGMDADRTAKALEQTGGQAAGRINRSTGQAVKDVRGATGSGMENITRESQRGATDLRGQAETGMRDIRGRTEQGVNDLRGATGQGVADINQERGRIGDMADQYTGQMNSELGRADRLDQRQQGVFQPLEDRFVDEAKSYNTAARQDFNAGRAMTDVGDQFAAQREQAQQSLQSYGIDPSQLRSGALDYANRAQQAAAQAGAGTTARERTEDTGRQLLAQGVEMGRYTAQDRQAAMGNAQNAGGMALQGRGMAGNLAQAGGALGVQGYGAAGQLGQQGAQAAGQLGLQGYGQAGQMATQGAQAAGQLGVQGYGQAGQLGMQGYEAGGRMGMAGLSAANDTRMGAQNYNLQANQALMQGQGALQDWRMGNTMNLFQTSTQNDLARAGQGLQFMQQPYANLGFQSDLIGQQQGMDAQRYQDKMARFNAKQQSGGGWGQTLGTLAGTALGASTGMPFAAQIGGQLGGQLGGGSGASPGMSMGGGGGGGGGWGSWFGGGQQPPQPGSNSGGGGFFAEGGPIRSAIPDPSGRGDTVPMYGSDGEMVIPRSVVMRLGTQHFEKLIQKYGDPTDVEASKGRQAIPVN